MVGTKNLIKKLLICSFGSIGKRHLRVIKKYDPSIKVAVYRSGKGNRSDDETLADFITQDLNESLEWDPSAAIICSPASDHLKQSIIFGRKKIPLLIEKPIGTGYENHSAWNDLKTIDQYVPILIGYTLRHNELIKKTKEYLKEKRIGKIIDADFYCGSWLPNWRPGQNYTQTVSSIKELGGGVLLELSHEIDLANWFFGPLVIHSAFSSKSNIFGIEVEDNCSIIAHNQNGSVITLRLNFCTQPNKRIISIRGENGQILIDLQRNKLEIYNDKKLISSETSFQKRNDIFLCQLIHFFGCIKKSHKPICTLNDGLEVLDLINNIKNHIST